MIAVRFVEKASGEEKSMSKDAPLFSLKFLSRPATQNDGMHQCPETFHGRVNAALVCLLDCRFNQQLLPSVNSLSACSDGCNSKYMNVNPIRFTLNADLNEEISLTS